LVVDRFTMYGCGAVPKRDEFSYAPGLDEHKASDTLYWIQRPHLLNATDKRGHGNHTSLYISFVLVSVNRLLSLPSRHAWLDRPRSSKFRFRTPHDPISFFFSTDCCLTFGDDVCSAVGMMPIAIFGGDVTCFSYIFSQNV